MLKKRSENATEVARAAKRRKILSNPKRSTSVSDVSSIKSPSRPDTRPGNARSSTEAFPVHNELDIAELECSREEYLTQPCGRS